MMVYWLGIFICLMQSAMFSGLTIGLFGLSRLRLEVESAARNEKAIKVLRLRDDASFLLATLLWGNVGVNVILTLLTGSVMTGVGAFLFSTVAITIFGEIAPQAYLSRHALDIGAFLVPVVKVYQVLLFPIAKPTAFLLDLWLGKENIEYFEEKELAVLIKKHIKSVESDIGSLEGVGAINFLALDDAQIVSEGETIHPDSIVALPTKAGLPIFPRFKEKHGDKFLQKIHASDKKWVILTDEKTKEPSVVLDADGFLRHTMFEKEETNPYYYCHRPVLVTSSAATLGQVIPKLSVAPQHDEDDVVDHDIILYWGETPKIITGSDILGRLLRNIVRESTYET